MSKLNKELAYPYNLIENIMDLNLHVTCDDGLPSNVYESVEYVLKTLNKQQAEFVELRYKKNMTYQQIGDIYHLSRERVRQVINAALRRLSHPQRWKYIKYGFCEAEEMSKLDKIVVRR